MADGRVARAVLAGFTCPICSVTCKNRVKAYRHIVNSHNVQQRRQFSTQPGWPEIHFQLDPTASPRPQHVSTASPRPQHVSTASPRPQHVPTASPRPQHVPTASPRPQHHELGQRGHSSRKIHDKSQENMRKIFSPFHPQNCDVRKARNGKYYCRRLSPCLAPTRRHNDKYNVLCVPGTGARPAPGTDTMPTNLNCWLCMKLDLYERSLSPLMYLVNRRGDACRLVQRSADDSRNVYCCESEVRKCHASSLCKYCNEVTHAMNTSRKISPEKKKSHSRTGKRKKLLLPTTEKEEKGKVGRELDTVCAEEMKTQKDLVLEEEDDEAKAAERKMKSVEGKGKRTTRHVKGESLTMSGQSELTKSVLDSDTSQPELKDASKTKEKLKGIRLGEENILAEGGSVACGRITVHSTTVTTTTDVRSKVTIAARRATECDKSGDGTIDGNRELICEPSSGGNRQSQRSEGQVSGKRQSQRSGHDQVIGVVDQVVTEVDHIFSHFTREKTDVVTSGSNLDHNMNVLLETGKNITSDTSKDLRVVSETNVDLVNETADEKAVLSDVRIANYLIGDSASDGMGKAVSGGNADIREQQTATWIRGLSASNQQDDVTDCRVWIDSDYLLNESSQSQNEQQPCCQGPKNLEQADVFSSEVEHDSHPFIVNIGAKLTMSPMKKTEAYTVNCAPSPHARRAHLYHGALETAATVESAKIRYADDTTCHPTSGFVDSDTESDIIQLMRGDSDLRYSGVSSPAFRSDSCSGSGSGVAARSVPNTPILYPGKFPNFFREDSISVLHREVRRVPDYDDICRSWMLSESEMSYSENGQRNFGSSSVNIETFPEHPGRDSRTTEAGVSKSGGRPVGDVGVRKIGEFVGGKGLNTRQDGAYLDTESSSRRNRRTSPNIIAENLSMEISVIGGKKRKKRKMHSSSKAVNSSSAGKTSTKRKKIYSENESGIVSDLESETETKFQKRTYMKKSIVPVYFIGDEHFRFRQIDSKKWIKSALIKLEQSNKCLV